MKKVVLIGGGHGLSNIVKGFKNENVDLTIVVSSTDDGGHTGKIRDEFNVVALGDLRRVLYELLDDNVFLKNVFDYRFDLLHDVDKVSLGNLILCCLYNKYGDINKVIDFFKEKENIKANVYLSSDNPLTLCAKCKNGEVVKNEHMIGICDKKIEDLYVDGEAICNVSMLKKIEEADVIVLGPGSLYTSVGSVLCIDKIKNAIKASFAEIVYVCNIMCQKGETSNYNVNDHEEALVKIIDRKIDRVIVNIGKIEEDVLKRYEGECRGLVNLTEIKQYYELYDLVEIEDNKVIHNSELTKKIILKQ